MSIITGLYSARGIDYLKQQGSRLMNALADLPADHVLAWQDDHAYLCGHTQWITPESVNALHPLHDEEQDAVIVADAIIDNREELFELLDVDRRLRTAISDHELILMCYGKWGVHTASRLIGDFAFVIWNRRERLWYGARDFSGGRTLYYCWMEGQFAFSSLIKPLLQLSDIGCTLNEEWLAEFLAISSMVDAVDAHETVYDRIKQVPPSHYFVLKDDSLQLTQYCKLEQSDKRLKLRSDEEYVEAFQEVFQQAVNARLRTHRGIGAQLSGGLDSGAIVGFALRSLREKALPLQTFSYVPVNDFKDFTSSRIMPNERPFIEKTVQHVGGMEAHYLDFRGKDSYSDIDEMLSIMEMPYKFFSNSFWLKGIYEEAQKRDIGILLNGGRGNLTISWGDAVPYYAQLLKRMRWFKLMRELRLHSYAIGSGRGFLLRAVSNEAFPLLKRFTAYSHQTTERLINPEFAKRKRVYEKLREHGIDQSGWFADGDVYRNRHNHFQELFHWNASNTLASKLSYKHNVWKRDPTNDWRVIQFCLSLPEEQYVRDGMSRAMVRRATANILPDEIRLNERVRGAQGVDWLHRITPSWNSFYSELEQMSRDRRLLSLIDGKLLESLLIRLRGGVKPDDAIGNNLRSAMYALIVYRFLQKNA
ncbi:asparagine synthase-related protein [Paenibacillus sp. PL2-23]|uniref:asparagine synthase-related protein n=1 Tax=Paenibacillus sp. PL2-23 TaxID=2100729 RepID=UPI0030FC79ED